MNRHARGPTGTPCATSSAVPLPSARRRGINSPESESEANNRLLPSGVQIGSKLLRFSGVTS